MRKPPTLALVFGTLVLAVSVACRVADAPAPPSPVGPTGDVFGPDGSVLKVSAPAPQSPANGSQISASSGVPLVTGNVNGTHASIPILLDYEVRNAAGTLLASPRVIQAAGTTTTYVLTNSLEASVQYNWRVRATYNGAFGPWSPTFMFRAPDIPQAYIRGNEVFDPLTDGKTIGTVTGPVQWIPGTGVRLTTQSSHITYTLPTNLQEGTFSIMVTDVDESNPGDKAKIFSMQENGGDVTTNDYRMTAELRGRLYPNPGAVQARIITGDAREEFHRIFDTPRIVVDFSRLSWYFWRVSWRTGSFTLEARRDSPNGAVMYSQTVGTGASPYRPTPHVLHLGAPVGRAGPNDATAAGMIVRNVWVSSNQTRPAFPVP